MCTRTFSPGGNINRLEEIWNSQNTGGRVIWWWNSILRLSFWWKPCWSKRYLPQQSITLNRRTHATFASQTKGILPLKGNKFKLVICQEHHTNRCGSKICCFLILRALFPATTLMDCLLQLNGLTFILECYVAVQGHYEHQDDKTLGLRRQDSRHPYPCCCGFVAIAYHSLSLKSKYQSVSRLYSSGV